MYLLIESGHPFSNKRLVGKNGNLGHNFSLVNPYYYYGRFANTAELKDKPVAVA